MEILIKVQNLYFFVLRFKLCDFVRCRTHLYTSKSSNIILVFSKKMTKTLNRELYIEIFLQYFKITKISNSVSRCFFP